jgi:hypothetical protein
MDARAGLGLFALAIATTVFAPRAQAAPGQPEPSLEIREKVQLVTITAVVVEVDASCAPRSGGEAVIDVIVEQPIPGTTNANEGEGITSVSCDGVKHRVLVSVTGGPFHPGAANAYGSVSAGPLPAMMANDARKVSIGIP